MRAGPGPRPVAAAGLIVLAFIAFISLGLPDGLLGVAWPSIRGDFRRPLDSIGALLLAVTAGYLTACFGSGYSIARLGVGNLLALSCAVTGISLVGYTLVPGWWMLVVLGVLTGLGAGAIDAGLNTFVAAHFGERLMHWLHASWGIGITLGPLIMALGLDRYQSWRWGYLLVGTAQILLGAYFAATASRWQIRPAPDGSSKPLHATHPAACYSETLAEPRVWFSLSLFLVYTGIEATLGVWAYTLLTESRGIIPKVAGFWTGGYWATFTIGRILAGLFTNRVGERRLLRASLAGAVASAAILAWNPTPGVGLAAVVLLGFAIAPVFPALVSGTRDRVGERHTANTIGMQMAVAGLGAALIPAVAGVFARHRSIETIPVFLVVLTVALFLMHAVVGSRNLPRARTPG